MGGGASNLKYGPIEEIPNVSVELKAKYQLLKEQGKVDEDIRNELAEEYENTVNAATLSKDNVTSNNCSVDAEESFLQSMISGAVLLMVTSFDINSSGVKILRVEVIDKASMEASRSDYVVLSYRWGPEATAFANKYNWDDALANLVQSRKFDIVPPSLSESDKDEEQLALAKTFYDSVIKIFHRTGIKYLWIDQLCIPQQNRPEKMQIVMAAGSFYHDFQVLVWVWWILLSNEELDDIVNKLPDHSQITRGFDFSLHVQLAKDMIGLYAQTKRGWILREVSSDCCQLKSELDRNLLFIRRIKNKLIDAKNWRNTFIHDRDRDSDYNNIQSFISEGFACSFSNNELFNAMTGVGSTHQQRVKSAGDLTLARFSFVSDRTTVSIMEKFDEVINITVINPADTNIALETQDKRYLTLLRLITFIGTGAYTNTKFKDWSVYNYDTTDIKKIIDWLYTCSEHGTLNSFSTNLTSIFIVILHERLLSGAFTAYLPADQKLMDTSVFATCEEVELIEWSDSYTERKVTLVPNCLGIRICGGNGVRLLSTKVSLNWPTQNGSSPTMDQAEIQRDEGRDWLLDSSGFVHGDYELVNELIKQ